MKWARISVDFYICAPHGHTNIVYPCGAEVNGKVADLALADGAANVIGGPTKGAPQPYPQKAEVSGASWPEVTAGALSASQAHDICNLLNASRIAVLHETERQDRFLKSVNRAINDMIANRADVLPDPRIAFERVRAVSAALEKTMTVLKDLSDFERDLFDMKSCDVSAIEATLDHAAATSDFVASSLKLAPGQKLDAPPGRWAIYLAWRVSGAYRSAFGKKPSASLGGIFFRLVNEILGFVGVGVGGQNGGNAIGRDALRAILK